jgi:hypothetical protein
MVFEDSRQRGHSEGPWMPYLRRFSTVKILPWTRSQQKLLILGSEGSDHISFQILEGGGGGRGFKREEGYNPPCWNNFYHPNFESLG